MVETHDLRSHGVGQVQCARIVGDHRAGPGEDGRENGNRRPAGQIRGAPPSSETTSAEIPASLSSPTKTTLTPFSPRRRANSPKQTAGQRRARCRAPSKNDELIAPSNPGLGQQLVRFQGGSLRNRERRRIGPRRTIRSQRGPEVGEMKSRDAAVRRGQAEEAHRPVRPDAVEEPRLERRGFFDLQGVWRYLHSCALTPPQGAGIAPHRAVHAVEGEPERDADREPGQAARDRSVVEHVRLVPFCSEDGIEGFFCLRPSFREVPSGSRRLRNGDDRVDFRNHRGKRRKLFRNGETDHSIRVSRPEPRQQRPRLHQVPHPRKLDNQPSNPLGGR